jgi:hypothetical protein
VPILNQHGIKGTKKTARSETCGVDILLRWCYLFIAVRIIRFVFIFWREFTLAFTIVNTLLVRIFIIRVWLLFAGFVLGRIRIFINPAAAYKPK